MQTDRFLKTAGFTGTALIVVVSLFFIMSSSSEERSNTQAIEQLSVELAALKAANAEAPVGLEPYIGEITMFGGNFAPRGWALCDGRLLSISQYSALYSILGNNYGGDGRTTFGLPDLRGRVPAGAGLGPGLTNLRLGDKSGAQQAVINVTTGAAAAPVGRSQSQVSVVTGLPNHINLMQPTQGVNFIIALEGVFPPRN